VLPGGIDSHVHLSQPSGPGIVMADDFESGTRAAAFGGNTMVLPFAMQQKGESLREVVKQYHAKADGNCYVDVSFHLIIADATDRVLGQELPALVEDGYTSFKVFMTYEGMALSDMEMLNVMSVARETGALVMVHAENYDAIRFLTDRLERAGKTAPHFHPRVATDPGRARGDAPRDLARRTGRCADHDRARLERRSDGGNPPRATARIEDLWRDLPAISRADREGHGRPQHGGREVCLLSAAARREESKGMLGRIAAATCFSLFSSDHCPFRYDTQGKLAPKGRTSFRWVPNGIPGVETRLPILFSEGVKKGRISLNEFVAFTATNHAKTYGLLSEEGHDRGRLGRRHRDLGPGCANHDLAVAPASRLGLHAV